MDNMYEPPGGDPTEESRPTEQFWPMGHGPGGEPRAGIPEPGYQDAGYQDPLGGPRLRAAAPPHPLRWTAGLVAAGALARRHRRRVALAGHSSAGRQQQHAAGPGTQAAALNTALNSADQPGTLALTSSSAAAAAAGASAAGGRHAAHPCAAALKAARAARQAGHPAVARAARAAAGAALPRLRRRIVRVALLRGIDGQFTFRAKGGTVRTLAFERGIVQSVSGSDIVVQRGRRHHLDLGPGEQHRRPGERVEDQPERAGRGRAGLGGRPGAVRGQGRPARRDQAALGRLRLVQPVTRGFQRLRLRKLSIRRITGHPPAGGGPAGSPQAQPAGAGSLLAAPRPA